MLLAVIPSLSSGQSPVEVDRSSLQSQNPVTAVFGELRDSPRFKNSFASLPAPIRGGGVCGDSEPDPGEECDDGNTTPGDGCSAVCTVEAGFDCTMAVEGQFEENLLTDGSFENYPDGSWGSIDHSLFGPDFVCGDGCFGTPAGAGPDGELVSGNFVLVAGGTFSGETTGSVFSAQTVFPTDATTLSFQWATLFSGPDGDPCASDFDRIEVWIDGIMVWTSLESGLCTNSTTYDQISIDLSGSAAVTACGGTGCNDGELHVFGFEAYATGVPPDVALTNIMLDDVRLNVPLDPPVLPQPSECTAIVCGDGLLGSTEQCDDGNLVNGDGCSNICEIEQPDFVCEDPIPPADSGEDVHDGGLESGNPNDFWQSTGVQFDPICSQVLCGAAIARTGAFFGWFGGTDLPNHQTLTQTTTISSTATDLTFQLLVGACDSANDSLTIEIDGTEIYRYDCTVGAGVYEPVSVSLGGYADGGVHTIEFIGNTVSTNGGNSNFFVDDISIPDNVAFAGAPGQCQELATACGVIEQFDTIPAGWTVLNLGPDSADGWGTSTDGVCATANWSPGDPLLNVTNGGGTSACADSDATGQADIDGGGSPLTMNTYLCSPAQDLSVGIVRPHFSFLANYQAVNNALNDNGTPSDPTDDYDDDFLSVLVGTVPPDAATLPGYTPLGNVSDHLDSTLSISGAQSIGVDLTSETGESEVYVCFHYQGTYAWYAQVDNAGLRADVCSGAPDSDGDGFPDAADNCTDEYNPDQLDTDGDNYGNICDGDFNNDCVVNFLDLGILKSRFFSGDPETDLNGDGHVNVLDLAIHREMFFAPPGPGLGSCASP